MPGTSGRAACRGIFSDRSRQRSSLMPPLGPSVYSMDRTSLELMRCEGEDGARLNANTGSLDTRPCLSGSRLCMYKMRSGVAGVPRAAGAFTQSSMESA